MVPCDTTLPEEMLLYRAHSPQVWEGDIAVRGIYPTAPEANISIQEHVQRGGFGVFRPSQFISATKSLHHAIRWACESNSKLVIINIQQLQRENCSIIDLSYHLETFSAPYRGYVEKHSEVLIQPYISPNAITVLSCDDLFSLNCRGYHAWFLPDLSWEWRADFFKQISRRFRDFYCTHCGRQGHRHQTCVYPGPWYMNHAAIGNFNSQLYFPMTNLIQSTYGSIASF